MVPQTPFYTPTSSTSDWSEQHVLLKIKKKQKNEQKKHEFMNIETNNFFVVANLSLNVVSYIVFMCLCLKAEQ